MSTAPKAAGPVNLPVPLTRFVGREAELAEASALLAGNRLLTLTGPGGAGKTRLALPSGPRTAPRRQSTLAASFDWSYELLSDPERALLRQLSVFAGGFDVEAALAVCPAASLELLAALTDRSLIIVDGRGSRPESRYKMLETVRQFAAEHLDEAEEVELMRTRHRDYYLRLAETAEPQMFGSEHDRWRATLRAELDNFRAALAWSRDRGDAEALCKMVVALTPSWLMRLAYAEAEVWVGPAASRAPEVPPLLRARLRNVHCLVALLSESAKSWGARGRVGRWPPARPATRPPLRAMVSTAAAVRASPAILVIETSPTLPAAPSRATVGRLRSSSPPSVGT